MLKCENIRETKQTPFFYYRGTSEAAGGAGGAQEEDGARISEPKR